MLNQDIIRQIQQARAFSRMWSADDIENFEKTIWQLAETQEPEVLGELLDLFDDNCEFPEVMYSLVHAVESYPVEVYVKILVEKIPVIIDKNPLWLDCLVNRVFNDRAYLGAFKTNMFRIPSKFIKQLFVVMRKQSPHHIELIKQLDVIIDQSP